jgi:hypothetical protein
VDPCDVVGVHSIGALTVTTFRLLSRDDFRAKVFARDSHRCLVCKGPAVDAHHILERRLWPDGGYYLENGASLCETHHLEAESTALPCEALRELARIKAFPLPPHLYKDQPYDKWGNPVLPNGQRLRGELFDDHSVQKILGSALSLFTNRVKYPRTWHLPWSPGATKDDRILESTRHFDGKDVVVTVKMDGENTTMYSDYLHARSIDYEPHPSRSIVKALHARVARDIPESWRICGENLFAKHSIAYSNLDAYFQVFSIWNDQNRCLDWQETVYWADLLDLSLVPVLYSGIWDPRLIQGLHQETYRGDPCEGYVVRLAGGFHYRDFKVATAKYVRNDHVQTHGHWMRSRLEPNRVKS